MDCAFVGTSKLLKYFNVPAGQCLTKTTVEHMILISKKLEGDNSHELPKILVEYLNPLQPLLLLQWFSHSACVNEVNLSSTYEDMGFLQGPIDV